MKLLEHHFDSFKHEFFNLMTIINGRWKNYREKGKDKISKNAF